MRSGPPPVHQGVRVVPGPGSGQALVLLEGEVDIAARSALADVRAWLEEEHRAAVVDGAGVTFLDCAGWSAVCSLVPAGSQPVVRRPSSAVRLLLGALAAAEGSRGGPEVPMPGHRAPRG